MPSFQFRVNTWMLECFGQEIADDILERNDRFIEEALELVQALDYNRERAHALVDYVFNRPVGEYGQEVGGTMVTLAALCNASEIDLWGEAEKELARINAPEIVLKIRAKQASKPKGSALPIVVNADSPSAMLLESMKQVEDFKKLGIRAILERDVLKQLSTALVMVVQSIANQDDVSLMSDPSKPRRLAQEMLATMNQKGTPNAEQSPSV